MRVLSIFLRAYFFSDVVNRLEIGICKILQNAAVFGEEKIDKNFSVP